ncbi:salicylate hydroxylase [Nannizzia gypsea CBS 118893]|uniref:Salicylate hydroxylase n=1 Tax=Arthroderma gypseum (strain ATCC MYA-4604 / CBS 118893) TaxID=535722 RepID=E4UWZ3_ARTGP|nr:salicylate hydroxylase [Nannizzia gypsea CBS 118893]EFR02632.1 salicylate hydroxylase [Nannizzia gypsea CBS 118893]
MVCLSEICIIGGGVSGLASALTLAKYLSTREEHANITVYELRDLPASLGGAVNLTPNALRNLYRLEVLPHIYKNEYGTEVDRIELFSNYSGPGQLASMDFVDAQGEPMSGLKGLRVMRLPLLLAMINAIDDTALAGITLNIVYGKKLVKLEHSNAQGEGKVQVSFEDGTVVEADLVLGCDGIHSKTRMSYVDPDRVPVYTGISVAQGYVARKEIASDLHFKDTGMIMARRGSLLTSFYESTRKFVYLAAVTESKEALSRDGWKAKGEDQEAVKADILDRFGDSIFPCVREMITASNGWYLFPVYKLPPGGKWCTERVMLLGDAAHAMPPQGESIGIAIEDAILFARTLAKYRSSPLSETFRVYEELRRHRIDEQYQEASSRWETVRDCGYIVTKLKEMFVPWWIWWTSKARTETFLSDAESVIIP